MLLLSEEDGRRSVDADAAKLADTEAGGPRDGELLVAAMTGTSGVCGSCSLRLKLNRWGLGVGAVETHDGE
jgi:hypothetical protein